MRQQRKIDWLWIAAFVVMALLCSAVYAQQSAGASASTSVGPGGTWTRTCHYTTSGSSTYEWCTGTPQIVQVQSPAVTVQPAPVTIQPAPPAPPAPPPPAPAKKIGG